jgi:two-component system response regulator AlgR
MHKLRILIVDDEPLARLRLRSLLADLAAERQPPAIEIVGDAASAAEALHALQRLPVDAVLLDIGLPGLDGLALAQRLRGPGYGPTPAQTPALTPAHANQPADPHTDAPAATHAHAGRQDASADHDVGWPPAVVFVTAQPEHALRAFEIDAVDYLTKPVRRARLQEALARVAQRRLRPGATAAPPAAAAGVPAASDASAVLVVSDRGRVLRVPVHEVLFLRAEQKYVTLRTHARSYVLDDSLADLEQRLGAAVVRIHRNALVAKAAVRRLERRPMATGPVDDDATAPAGSRPKPAEMVDTWAVQLAPGDDWLPVSRRQLSAVKAALAD